MENNIIKKPKFIVLGCYNPHPFVDLLMPFPSKTYNQILQNVKIDAIYFDGGFRHLPLKTLKSYTIEDLLALSNGAKNIYLFTFNVQKIKKVIELPESSDPYTAIRNWKRENNFIFYPPLIEEGNYDETIKELEISLEITSPLYKKINIPFKTKIVSHIFETDNTFYLLVCNDIPFKIKLAEKYGTNYMKWLNQCYIKYGCYYSGNEVRNKFGRSSRTIYDENGNSCWYYYETGIFFDCWRIDGNDTAKTYYKFLDTTPPPLKPKELD